MPRGTISRIERGDKRLDCLTMLRLAAHLKFSVDDFFSGAPDTGLSPFLLPQNGVAISDVEAVLKSYKAIENPEIRSEILSLVRSVADSSDNE